VAELIIVMALHATRAPGGLVTDSLPPPTTPSKNQAGVVSVRSRIQNVLRYIYRPATLWGYGAGDYGSPLASSSVQQRTSFEDVACLAQTPAAITGAPADMVRGTYDTCRRQITVARYIVNVASTVYASLFSVNFLIHITRYFRKQGVR
jgi:hypothetical protein